MTFITEEKVRAAIIKSKNNEPSQDKIPMALFKIGPASLLATFVRLYNGSFRLGYVPRRRKETELVFVRKPGKPHEGPNSYRPISLLPAVAKILKRVIHQRLTQECIIRDTFSELQMGFREGRSCGDCFWKLSSQIREKSKKQCTAALFLDVERAFNSVCHDGLRCPL